MVILNTLPLIYYVNTTFKDSDCLQKKMKTVPDGNTNKRYSRIVRAFVSNILTWPWANAFSNANSTTHPFSPHRIESYSGSGLFNIFSKTDFLKSWLLHGSVFAPLRLLNRPRGLLNPCRFSLGFQLVQTIYMYHHCIQQLCQ